MGFSILDVVILRLREAHFTAEAAYPGQKFPPITAPISAVHIEKVDRAGLKVTVGVDVFCPAAMGGTACELEALGVTEALRGMGAVCIQNGCRYDGVAQVYGVSILADFTAVTGAENCTIGPGFYVYLNDSRVLHVTGFQAEELPGYQQEFAMGEQAPAFICRSPGQWQIRMEELIPFGSPEEAEPGADFELKIITDVQIERYRHCDFTSIRREYTREGLRRIREGVALEREVL